MKTMENENPAASENKNIKSHELDVSFWNHCWKSGQTGWDVGYATQPITEYLDQYENKDAAVLIPGCGNAYEAAYMLDLGFTNITLLDISDEAVKIIKEKFKSAPQVKVLCEDFFEHEGKYDLIIEQTFFCAQVLERRSEYVKKASSILNENGRLAGVLFGISFGPSGPPFGGRFEEYRILFSPFFQLKTMEPCYNSIPPRSGSELFITFIKIQKPD